MKFSHRKEEKPGVSITPLIDIVFLLLIFFMLTSHFHVASGIPIRLPKVTQKSFNQEDQRVVVVMDRLGRCYLRGEEVNFKNLGPKLEKLVEDEGLASLIIQADKEVKHGRVVHIMDLAKMAGVVSIVIAAQWQSGKVL